MKLHTTCTRTLSIFSDTVQCYRLLHVAQCIALCGEPEQGFLELYIIAGLEYAMECTQCHLTYMHVHMLVARLSYHLWQSYYIVSLSVCVWYYSAAMYMQHTWLYPNCPGLTQSVFFLLCCFSSVAHFWFCVCYIVFFSICLWVLHGSLQELINDTRNFTLRTPWFTVIGASLSEPHTSMTALRTRVCMLACLLGLTTYRKF